MRSAMLEPLRVGCIVDDGPQSHSVHDLVEKSRASEHYSIVLLIVQKASAREADGAVQGAFARLRTSGLKRRVERACLRFVERLEQIVVGRLTGFKDHFRTYPLESFEIPQLHTHPSISRRGRVFRYTPQDLAGIKAQELDILLYFGREGALRGEILSACRLGVICWANSGNHAGRGGPAGFWEVYEREPTTELAIRRLRGGVQDGGVLFKGALNTARLYLLNTVNLARKSVAFMHLFLESVARNPDPPPVIEKNRKVYPLYRTPSLRHQLTYLYRTASHIFERAVRRLLGARWRWSVAYQFTDSWQAAELAESRIIKNPPGRFFADPCVVEWNGQSICFVEDYDGRTSIAKITAIRLEPDGYEELGVALEEPFHLSYPFVFEVQGELYMCPETEQAREIRLYKCVEFPLTWKLHRVLRSDVAAVDTGIVRHGGRWWMLTNIDTAGIGDYRSELHLFHADEFDSSDWQPHPANPVIFDSSRARNGGLFVAEGNLYRVFQVQGFDVYGESMGVALVRELSTENYLEEIVARIPPTFFPGIEGTHSLTFNGRVLALDVVRRERLGK
jgi:hypothetical protein